MFAKFSKYLKETSQEMQRVSWPTFADLKESTVVVCATVGVVTFFVFVVDQVLSFIQKKLILMS